MKGDIQHGPPPGWSITGSNPDAYRFGLNRHISYRGKPCAFIEGIDLSPPGFGALTQSILAKDFIEKHIQFSGFVKSKDVSAFAGLWMRIDGEDGRTLEFDNMSDRPINGSTGWTEYKIVLDVPFGSAFITFGALLQGGGKIWLNGLSLVAVEANIPTTNVKINPLRIPRNLDFLE